MCGCGFSPRKLYLPSRRDPDHLVPPVLAEELEALADRVLLGPELLRHRLVDHHHVRRVRVVARGEVAAALERDAHRLEVAGLDRVELHQLAVLAVRAVDSLGEHRAQEAALEERHRRSRASPARRRAAPSRAPACGGGSRARAPRRSPARRGRRVSTASFSWSKPGSMRCALPRLLTNSPAPTSATSESATWPATSRLRRLQRPVAADRGPAALLQLASDVGARGAAAPARDRTRARSRARPPA